MIPLSEYQLSPPSGVSVWTDLHSDIMRNGGPSVKRRRCSPGGNVLGSDDGQQLVTNRQELTQRIETVNTIERGKSSWEILKT